MEPRFGKWIFALLIALSAYHLGYGLYHSQEFGFVDFHTSLRDVAHFLETGELYRQGDDLAQYGPSAEVNKFPPLYSALLLVLLRADLDDGAFRVYWWVQIGLYLASVGILLWFLQPRRRGIWLALGLVVACNFEPFFETLWRLQIETPILFLLSLFLWTLHRRHDLWAGSVLGLTVMLKIYPVFLLAYLVVRRRWLALAGCLATMVATVGVTWLVFGARANSFFFLELLPHMLAEPPLPIAENLAPARFLIGVVGLDPGMAKLGVRIVSLPLLALTIWFVHRAPRTRDAVGLGVELAPFLGLLLLTMPKTWVNYQLILLPPLLALAAAALGDPAARGRWVVAALVSAVLTLFYAPCAAAEIGWPCTRTPYFLGLLQLPRSLHDLLVAWRAIVPLAVWVAGMELLARRHRDVAGPIRSMR